MLCFHIKNSKNNNEQDIADNMEEENNQDNFEDNLSNFLDDIGSTIIDNSSKKEIDQRALVYNPNEFANTSSFREDSQSPIFSDFGSEDDEEMSGSDLDLDDFIASLVT